MKRILFITSFLFCSFASNSNETLLLSSPSKSEFIVFDWWIGGDDGGEVIPANALRTDAPDLQLIYTDDGDLITTDP